MGFKIDAADITAFTAIVQIGAVAAVVIYFWGELWGIVDVARPADSVDPGKRDTRDFRFGLAVAVGSIPIAIVGLALRHVIEGPLRSLWVVGVALIVWSFAMLVADRRATQARGEDDFNMRDADRHGADAVHRPDPGRLALRGDDRRRALRAASTGSRSRGCRSSSRSRR